MSRIIKSIGGLPLVIIMLTLMITPVWAYGPAVPFSVNDQFNTETPLPQPVTGRAYGDPVDFTASLLLGADYLQAMQADITDDNAGNGTDGVDETPDDPDDGGWNWVVTSPPAPFHHTTAASSLNLYGATVQGIYHAYLATGDADYMIALTDAADAMVADAGIRSGPDVVFLLQYQALPDVSGATYMDAARAKYDSRITTYNDATGLAEYIRDLRHGQGYDNGIIAWDIGVWAKAAAMLDADYSGQGYDSDAGDIAEVIWQDSFNDSPGYFDIIDDQGYDPDYNNVNYYWYALGISGLIQAFDFAQVHTDELPGLVDIMMECTDSYGGVSYSYGGFDADWQSTAYGALCLADLDLASHQLVISKMGNFLVITQDEVHGCWIYDSGNHYPEINGECAAAVSFGAPPDHVIVDDDFTDQVDVDLYNTVNGAGYVYGYDAFGTIRNGVDAVNPGGVVDVIAGSYPEKVFVNKSISLNGAQAGVDARGRTGAAESTINPHEAYCVVIQADDVIIDGFEITSSVDWNCDTAGIYVSDDIGQPGEGETELSDVVVRNCRIHDLTDGLRDGGLGIAGIVVGPKTDDVEIAFNEIYNLHLVDDNYSKSPVGIEAWGHGSGDEARDTGVHHNLIHTIANDDVGVAPRGIQFSQYVWGGSIAGNEIYDITRGRGLRLGADGNGGIPLSGPGAVSVTGNTIYACGDAGVLIEFTATLTGNDISGCGDGIRVTESGDGSLINQNGIFGNVAGLINVGTDTVAAENNWWGDPTGPLDSSDDTATGGLYNPGGLGNAVSDRVDYDPWLGGNVVFTPDPQTISLADEDPPGVYRDGVVCEYLGGASGLLYGFSIDVTWDMNLIMATVGDFEKPDNGPFASPTWFAVQDHSAGSVGRVRIDSALPGDQSGIAAGELFKATFTAVGTPEYATSDLIFTLNEMRDVNNQDLTGFVTDDGLMIVDLDGPDVTAVLITNDTLAHTDDYLKSTDDITVTATVTDGDPGFGAANMTADLSGLGAGSAVVPDSYLGTTATWTLINTTCTPANGTITVTVTATDGAANSSSDYDTIIADNILPEVVADFFCVPVYNQIDCSWTDASGGDIHFYRTAIMQTPWGDYPNYATVEPDYPGVGVAIWSGETGTVATLNYLADGSERDIMYLQAYAVDIVLNYSLPDPGAQGRATNYWLGDVSEEITGLYGVYDGYVTIADMTQMGTYYGTSPLPVIGEPVDVGPTHNGYRLSIPEPDDIVDFEDLMIFSMNYNRVTPLPIFQQDAIEQPQLAWRMVEDGVWVLELTRPCLNLKGINLKSNLSPGSVLALQPGSLCNAQAGPVFLQNIDTGGLDAGLSLLGTDMIFIGSGELIRVTFADGVSPVGIEVLARSSDNQPLVPDMETTGAPDAMPTVYRMAQNFPNPFNPKTMISFDLPEVQDVKLAVFGPDGRKIVTLVNETMPAGFHSVAWNGRDAGGVRVASGVYFYRIEAGPLRQTSKMLMLK